MSYPPAQFPPAPQAASADDLTLPLRGASIGQAVTRFFKKYATFAGRASRSEFWWWTLVSVLVGLVYTVLDSVTSGGLLEARETAGSAGDILSYVWGLATLVPGLALGARRLHDIDKSGWWQLLVLVPLVGAIILIVWFATPPKPAGVTRDPGYQASGYGGYPQVGAYGQPDGGQYGPGAYGQGAYGGPPANDPYAAGPGSGQYDPGPYGGQPNPQGGSYGGQPNPQGGSYGGQPGDPYGPGPTDNPYGGGPAPR